MPPRSRRATLPEERWAVIAEAYREHAPRIGRHLLALTGEPASVDDLLSETFVQAYESLPRFEGRARLSTWLHGIATNVARAHRNKHRRRRRIDQALPPAPPLSASAETDLRERKAVERLYAAMNALSDDLRDAFVVCVLEQRSLKDASAHLGVPISTLHARRQRAEAQVRARLEEDAP